MRAKKSTGLRLCFREGDELATIGVDEFVRQMAHPSDPDFAVIHALVKALKNEHRRKVAYAAMARRRGAELQRLQTIRRYRNVAWQRRSKAGRLVADANEQDYLGMRVRAKAIYAEAAALYHELAMDAPPTMMRTRSGLALSAARLWVRAAMFDQAEAVALRFLAGTVSKADRPEFEAVVSTCRKQRETQTT